MNIACIFLTCNRPELSLRTIQQNFYNAEKDADVFLIDNGSEIENFTALDQAYPFKATYRFKKNKGIATAINKGIELAKEYDGIVTLANDILMPKGWLRVMCEYVESIPNTGMVGIHCVEALPALVGGVHEIMTPFGNALVTRQAIDTVGLFNTKFDPYGMQDADYGYRTTMSGLKNYYVPGFKSEHIGHDVGNGTEYRRMKDEGLAKAQSVWNKNMKEYEQKGFKIW